VSRLKNVNKILCITKGNYFIKIYGNTTINLSKKNTLLGSPTLNLEAKNSKRTKKQVTFNEDPIHAPRILPMHTKFLQRFLLLKASLSKYLLQLEKWKRLRWERQRSGRDLGIVTLH
jgi:hypothetical protein